MTMKQMRYHSVVYSIDPQCVIRVQCTLTWFTRNNTYFQGLRTTLTFLDEEMPRTENSVSNRQDLMNRLHVEHLVKRNKVGSGVN